MMDNLKLDWWRIHGLKQDQKLWTSIGIDRAEEAALWKAYGFSPDAHTEHWVKTGAHDPSAVEGWRAWASRRGEYPPAIEEWSKFSPGGSSDLDWMFAGFTPREAGEWKSSGFKYVPEVKEWVALGMTNARECQLWREARFDKQSAVKLRAKEFSVSKAAQWRDAGIPVAFMVYVRPEDDISVEDALEWTYCYVSMPFKLRSMFAANKLITTSKLEDLYYMGFEFQELEQIFFGEEPQIEKALQLADSFPSTAPGEEGPEWEHVEAKMEEIGLRL